MIIFRWMRGTLVIVWGVLMTLLISVASILIVFFTKSSDSVQWMARLWARSILFVAGVRVSVEGLEKVDREEPYIFAANHSSQFDILVLQGYLGINFRWLAKKELFQVPLWGRGMRAAGYIPIDRSRSRSALKSLEEAATRIASGTSVVLFPEGTRTPDGCIQPFKAGGMLLALKSGVSIVPVAISGTFRILPKSRLLPRPGKVRIRIGAPVSVKDYPPGKKQELADRIQAEVTKMIE